MTGNNSHLDINAPRYDERSSLISKTTTSSASVNDVSLSVNDATMSETSRDNGSRGGTCARRKLSELLKGKEEEWAAVAQKKGPLLLLDLPTDVLKEIVKEVTHTNDLTALALTHSALHILAIPHIYSRFDIVWPDATSANDNRTGVDALTYGLATLVMGHEVFGQHSMISRNSSQSSSNQFTSGVRGSIDGNVQRRLGNNYSHFTRKFSLGNGPSEWVQEYLITKESGKMLGTLVALAVARMVNLETFVWDMPTGVLRDVWLALSSLKHRSPHGECRLESVLVRWHDNSVDPGPDPTTSSQLPAAAVHSPPGTTVTPIGILISSDTSIPSIQASNERRNRVEYPNLSVLPPLKSLSVLDIDELEYLDEMSVLIQTSKDKLRELRVGISKRAHTRPFVLAWDGSSLQQVDHDENWRPGTPSSIDDRRLGGVLGILLGRIFDIRKKSKLAASTKHTSESVPSAPDLSGLLASLAIKQSDSSPTGPDQLSSSSRTNIVNQTTPGKEVLSLDHDGENSGAESLIDNSDNLDLHVSSSIISPGVEISQLDISQAQRKQSFTETCRKSEVEVEVLSSNLPPNQRKRLDGKLQLRTLELERVPLSIIVLQKAFDWSTITSLTILDCAYHEGLWRMLRKQFQPQPAMNGLSSLSSSRHGTSTSSKSQASPVMEYRLNLKKIHTDVATPALISFLKETLAPNTLEVLFLQDRRKNTTGSVTIDAIYRGPLRRHRRSLKKLLIDSSDKLPKGPRASNDSARWRSWMLTHEVLAYISSGSMISLRELSVAIDYKDWHYFLRRLPQIPTLRSLNIPFIADHVTPFYEPKELAMQVVDMIFLRPEIELCYLGISNKCFEILENRPQDGCHASTDTDGSGLDGEDDLTTDDEAIDDEDEDEDDEDEDEDEEASDDEEGFNFGGGTAAEAVETDGVEYDPSEHEDSDTDSADGLEDEKSKMSLRLREILFYDDKIAIFKARHMRL